MKSTKKQLLEQLSYNVLESNRYLYSPYQRQLMDDIESLNSFKDLMQHEYNKMTTIYDQIIHGKNDYQYYHGERYRYLLIDVEMRIADIISLCDYVDYEFYNPNGHWFIRSIVKQKPFIPYFANPFNNYKNKTK